MTTIAPAPPTIMPIASAPRRRTLVLLAAFFALAFAALMAAGQRNEAGTSITDIKASYDQSHAAVAVVSYAAMVACAVLVFLGAAVRSALRQRSQPWTADVATLGLVVIALTIASWAVSGLSMWHAADRGDDVSLRALNYIDTSNFLPLMLGLVCAMVGAGAAGLTGRALPRWVAIASLVLGCLAPLGPLGFIPTMLLPVWLVVVAVTLRLEPTAGA